MFLYIKFAFIFILPKCLLIAAIPSARVDSLQRYGIENQQSNDTLILMKFIQEQQLKKQHQLEQNHADENHYRQHFRHHAVTTTTTTTTRATSASRINVTPISVRRNISSFVPISTATPANAPSARYNATKPKSEKVILYTKKRKCNYHRRRC
ncbi:PREDICTED: uncharacterized protein LOC108380110 isoform X3 [Rhagoletis zephyria]|uniref:uncharacterized protein LOC108380110 isoform X2 n=1 Tax=Rhagoletis zephyria TaxID=28612 RepID=UPI0008116FFD|nr:PREDICTED: uncharacterized protein LOC108380110 isoform X2 [Rhagoletis zephyria]XP_017491971.1 PREDICTED: uncharacterized protein LOC108380110 isoform X3 [Rhagoletis zephyria]